MSRANWSVATRKRHKRVMKAVRGHRAARSRSYRVAKESLLHAQHYATVHRRLKKRQMRSLAIVRINAAARLHGTSYSKLMNGLAEADIKLDRKSLVDLAVNDSPAFEALVKRVAA